MNRKTVTIAVSVLFLLIISSPAVAQVLKGSLSGAVVDPNGAVVSGATVKATNSSTGAVSDTTSDSSGLFRFDLLTVGTYKVEISAPSFKTTVQNNVLVTASSDRDMGQVKLEIGQPTATVEITTEQPLITTTQSQVTTAFSGMQLQTFVGVQENQGLDNMALFIPGVNNTRDNTFSNSNGPGFSVNGLRGRNNDQEIDGQNNNDNSVGGPGLFLSNPEFVQQYVVITNQFGPEYGRNSGSVVNIITKSGGNAWHGSVFGTEANSALNAMNNHEKTFQGLKKPVRFNDEFAGFTIGGPLKKNKVFFFGGLDEERVARNAVFHTDALTPTPAGLTKLLGCFPASASLQAFKTYGPFGVTGGNPTATGPFVNLNVGTCTAVQFGGVTRTLSQPTHIFDFILRGDFQPTGSDTITARYIYNRNNSFTNDFGNADIGYPVDVPALSYGMLGSWTHNFSSRMVNEARVSYNSLDVVFGGNEIGNTVPPASGLGTALAQGTIQAPGFATLFGAANNLPQSRHVKTWQAQDNWNYIAGKHNFKAGVNWTFQHSPNIFLPNINGTYRFSSWTSFVNNTPNRVRIANGPSLLDFKEYDTFAYVGDDWKIGRDFTLNLGLTWTFYGQPANLFNQITTARESSASTAFWNPALPLSIRTLPTIPAPKNSFGPSVGFAYTPHWGGFLTGNGKTTFRGGYRMLYDPPFYNIYLNVSTSAPEVFLQTFTGASANTKPIPAVPTGTNVRASLAAFLTPGVFDPRTFSETQITPNFGPDKVHSYSFGIQREITKNAAFEVRYAGNRARNLFQTINKNPFIADLKLDFPNLVPSSLTPCAATTQVGAGAGTDVGRVSCGEGVVRQRTNTGYSNYNSLQMEFRANNLWKQLTLRSAYTWSKTKDNVSEIFSTFGGGNTTFAAQNPLDFKAGEFSISGLDIPQNFTIFFNEQLPFFKGQKGLEGHLLGGWSIGGNYILSSGEPYTPVQAFSAFATTCLGDTLPGRASGTCKAASGGNYYDLGYLGAFPGIDTARPFLGNLKAPATAVGIFAGDACNIFGATGTTAATTAVACGGTMPNSQLISLTALGRSCLAINPTATCTISNATKNDVRFIINAGEAQSVFGTPFGDARRNVVRDAIINTASLSLLKNTKLTERVRLDFHVTFTNVFNHPNFSSVDPFLEDAGLIGEGTGFGDVKTTNTTNRKIFFGLKLTF